MPATRRWGPSRSRSNVDGSVPAQCRPERATPWRPRTGPAAGDVGGAERQDTGQGDDGGDGGPRIRGRGPGRARAGGRSCQTPERGPGRGGRGLVPAACQPGGPPAEDNGGGIRRAGWGHAEDHLPALAGGLPRPGRRPGTRPEQARGWPPAGSRMIRTPRSQPGPGPAPSRAAARPWQESVTRGRNRAARGRSPAAVDQDPGAVARRDRRRAA